MRIEIFGPEPSCARCKASLKNARKAVEELGVDAEVVKKDVMSKEAMELGIILPPALVIEGKVMKLGAVPTVAEVKAAIEKVRAGRA